VFNSLFIQRLVSPDPGDRFYFFCVVLTVIVSITLHELAHGWMAIRLGDPTPRIQGRMTGNPLVHMGPFSLIALALVGIAWGQMPIDPTRLKGRYAEAKVAFAGPAINLLLAFAALTSLGLWNRFGVIPTSDLETPASKGHLLLMVFGVYNLILMVFNLIPVPPLDGSHILANYYRDYANAIADPSKSGIWMFSFFFIFMLAPAIFPRIMEAGMRYVHFVGGT